MEWTQIRVHCKVSELDEISAIMSMVDASLMIEDYSDIEENLMTVYGELIDEKILKSDRSAAAVSVYVPSEEKLKSALSFLKERFEELHLSPVVETVGVKEEDWANQWKQFYKPQHIGEHLLVLPPWEHCEIKKEDKVIVMDPGMAFGTGTHETTRLCLSMIEKHLKTDDTVLDIGTGSGILAIAAVKLGAKKVYAYDIDEVAVRVAKENAHINHASEQIVCGISDLLAGVDASAAPFDFVSANIVADILIRMAKDVGAFMKKGAKLVASGIIDVRRDDTLAAMEEGGLSLIEEGEERDWCVLVFEKR